uniref:Mediator of RNA polymerase II transcription subunit 21 n=1 Tax=Rhabditophanes sp. KR3021 TaxID=114890 RepID=A0AC35UIR3_9BILA
MSDSITQIQNMINAQANLMANAVGVLQATSGPCPFNDVSEDMMAEENSSLFSKEIVETYAFIDRLIESLPTTSDNTERTAKAVVYTNQKRIEKTECMKKQLVEADKFMKIINDIVDTVAKGQLKSRPAV